MDVYSFGMVLWELWHQSIPFDNDIKQATQYVLKEESRPKIIQSALDLDKDIEGEEDADDVMEEEKAHTEVQHSINAAFQHAASNTDLGQGATSSRTSSARTFCDPIISSLIRKCWTQDPNQRPKVFEICQLLHSKIQKDLSQDVVIVKV